MYGAIIGDVVGSRYELDGIKSKDFVLLNSENEYTDDTVMTVAVANALVRHIEGAEDFKPALIEEMQTLCKKYPKAGYGESFKKWLNGTDPKPYYSFANGSAMRVSPCALVARTLDEAIDLAKQSAEITHNHPDGIKGAQAVSAAIFLAKTGKSKEDIRCYINDNYYSLNKTLDQIRPDYEFDLACEESVPQAILCFLESENFEDALRNSVSLGGDSDTIAAMAGSIAWSYYSYGRQLPQDMQELRNRINSYLTPDILQCVENFERMLKSHRGDENDR